MIFSKHSGSVIECKQALITKYYTYYVTHVEYYNTKIYDDRQREGGRGDVLTWLGFIGPLGQMSEHFYNAFCIQYTWATEH